jgi:WD40 repeat protein/serine/threonine protein kinase
MADWNPRANDVFLRAVEIGAADKRREFLDAECAGDAPLREQVEALLAASEKVGSFLNQPAARVPEALVSTTDYRPITEGPGSVIGAYKLLQKIGEGGFGVVYMAEQARPVRRTVALKIIKPGMDTAQVMARFESERQALAMMDHPNIAKVLDAGATDSGRPYFVMELVKGVSITEFCDRNHMATEQRLKLFVDVCHAIEHAHHKGVIHRDIKPSNVMVTLHDGVPVVKVIDFGVAKATAQKLTERTLFTAYGQMIGTPAYMSPEQAEMSGLDIDTRSDVYSLGVLLYELLTGTTPLESRRLRQAGYAEMQRLIREEEPPRPSSRLSSLGDSATALAGNRGTDVKRLVRVLSGDLDWIIMRALEKDRNRRYGTPGNFAEDIARCLRHDAVQARPPSAAYRLRKYVRRHRAAVLTAAAVAAALILGTAVATWQAIVATAARNEATQQRDAAAAARDAESKARQEADEARGQAVAALATSKRLTSRLTYERGQALCEQGQIDLGMLWLARALELAPTEAADLERAIRVSLNGWAMQLNTVEAVFPFSEGVSGIALSPDGRTVITSHWWGGGGAVRFWDALTGQAKDLPLMYPGKAGGPAARVNKAIFSQDGRLIATASDDRTARIWDAATRQPLGPSMLHDDPVVDISFDAEAKVVATAAGKQIHFWNIATGKREAPPLALPQTVDGVVYSPDGKRLAAWAGETAWLWDAATRKPVGTPLKHSQEIRTAAFSLDSARLLTNLEDASRFWDAETGQPVGAGYSWTNRMGSTGYGRVAFRADGKLLATAGYGPRLWDPSIGKNTSAANSLLEAHYVALSPDGRQLIIARREGGFVRLAVAPGLAPLHSFPIGDRPFFMTRSPDEATCVTLAEDRDGVGCRLWNIQTGRQVGSRIAQDTEHLVWPAFSPDGRTLVTRAGKTGCQLRDTSTGREHGPLLEHPKLVCGLAFSPDSRMLVTGDVEGTIRFWDVAMGQALGQPLKHELSVERLRFSPDGRKLLAAGGILGGLRGEARLWDVVSREPLGPVLEHFGEVHDVAFRSDGKEFLTTGFQLRLWDAATSKELPQTFAVPNVISQAAFSPDGKTILARVFGDDVAQLFDAQTGKSICPPLRHQSQLSQAWFSPDGTLVLTTSDDRTARLWDAATGLPVGPPRKNDRATPSARFTENGRSLLILRDDSIARWPVPMPMEGTRERIRLAIEVATRHTLDPDGGVAGVAPVWSRDPKDRGTGAMTKDPWPAARERLLELGGPPGNLRR